MAVWVGVELGRPSLSLISDNALKPLKETIASLHDGSKIEDDLKSEIVSQAKSLLLAWG